ncbi:MAG: hypothetical protein R3F38_19815 [Gammaproteobacteria bacterium]
MPWSSAVWAWISSGGLGSGSGRAETGLDFAKAGAMALQGFVYLSEGTRSHA